MHKIIVFLAITGSIALAGCGNQASSSAADVGWGKNPATVRKETKGAQIDMLTRDQSTTDAEKVVKTEEEWREILTPEQYRVLREKGTERPFSNEYWETKTSGVYVCAACGRKLFDSEQKYDSGTGWPSYWKPIDEKAVDTQRDGFLGLTRTEVLCSRCGGHLGHVFKDGPAPTGLRYCINSAALRLIPRDSPKDVPQEVPRDFPQENAQEK